MEMLGWAGSALLIVSLLQTRVLRLRVLNTVAAVALVLFNALIEVWPMVAMNLAIIAINTYQIVRLRSAGQAEGYTLLEVDPRDEYLRHVQRVYEHDIRRTGPTGPRCQAPMHLSLHLPPRPEARRCNGVWRPRGLIG